MSHVPGRWGTALASLSLLSVLSLPVTPAIAAESKEAADKVQEEIVVTGSRIKRSDFTSATPITVIDGQSIMLARSIPTLVAVWNRKARGLAIASGSRTRWMRSQAYRARS